MEAIMEWLQRVFANFMISTRRTGRIASTNKAGTFYATWNLEPTFWATRKQSWVQAIYELERYDNILNAYLLWVR